VKIWLIRVEYSMDERHQMNGFKTFNNRKISVAAVVKTHVRNIFSKYDVGSRAELISTILKNQTVE
jgi:hypothetical protein